jgi:hypothetical protein
MAESASPGSLWGEPKAVIAAALGMLRQVKRIVKSFSRCAAGSNKSEIKNRTMSYRKSILLAT